MKRSVAEAKREAKAARSLKPPAPGKGSAYDEHRVLVSSGLSTAHTFQMDAGQAFRSSPASSLKDDVNGHLELCGALNGNLVKLRLSKRRGDVEESEEYAAPGQRVKDRSITEAIAKAEGFGARYQASQLQVGFDCSGS